MKVLLSILLIVSHLFSTIGVSIDMHECGGEKSYSLYQIHINEHCECDHTADDHTDDCCKSKKVDIKPQSVSKFIQKIIEKTFLKVFLFENGTELRFDFTTNISKQFFRFKIKEIHFWDPPPIYLLYQNFRI